MQPRKYRRHHAIEIWPYQPSGLINGIGCKLSKYITIHTSKQLFLNKYPECKDNSNNIETESL